MYFEILRGTDGYYWRIRGANHEILAHSETLTSVANCRNAIAVIRPVPIAHRSTTGPNRELMSRFAIAVCRVR